jgi:heme exporter protein C
MSSTIDRAPGRSIAVWGTVTAALTALAVIGSFLVAPEDADQGVIQRIFYFHVSIAIVSLVAFAVAFVSGVRYLRGRRERDDEIGVTSIGLGLLFSGLVVITGSIWAKASWGTWWVWEDPRLVTYVIVILLYAAYFMLRSSLDGERRLRYSAIFAIAAFAAVPLSFYSVRVAQSFVHPVVFTQSGANMPDTMLVWFVVSQLAMLALFVTLLQFELMQRRAERSLRELKLRLERAETLRLERAGSV